MPLKYVYVYVFGEERLPGYSSLYGLCHVPIDNILLGKKEFQDLPTFTESWSRVDNYSSYLSFQVRVREHFPGSAPLAVEFHVWQRADES
jgi:hypothetical protein